MKEIYWNWTIETLLCIIIEGKRSREQTQNVKNISILNANESFFCAYFNRSNCILTICLINITKILLFYIISLFIISCQYVARLLLWRSSEEQDPVCLV